MQFIDVTGSNGSSCLQASNGVCRMFPALCRLFPSNDSFGWSVECQLFDWFR